MPLISICSLYSIEIIKLTSSKAVKYSFYLVYPYHLPPPLNMLSNFLALSLELSFIVFHFVSKYLDMF